MIVVDVEEGDRQVISSAGLTAVERRALVIPQTPALFADLEDDAQRAGHSGRAQTPPTPPVSNCAPSYPTVCIPPPPPDLDCGDIPYRDFTVLPPDPHRFDGDGDGMGCET